MTAKTQTGVFLHRIAKIKEKKRTQNISPEARPWAVHADHYEWRLHIKRKHAFEVVWPDELCVIFHGQTNKFIHLCSQFRLTWEKQILKRLSYNFI